MLKRGLVGALLAAVVLMAPALPANAGGHTVKATQQKKFSPSTISVNKGDKVVWKNTSNNLKHTVTAISSNWSKNTKIKAGQSTSFKFTKAGTYKYICSIHPGMSGKVVVH
jgi:plastocyanin